MRVLYKELWDMPSMSDINDIEVYENINQYILYKPTSEYLREFIAKNIGTDRPFIRFIDEDIYIPYLDSSKIALVSTIKTGTINGCIDLTSSSFGPAYLYGNDDDDDDEDKTEYNSPTYINEQHRFENLAKEKTTLDNFYPKQVASESKNDSKDKKDNPFKDRKSSFFGGFFG